MFLKRPIFTLMRYEIEELEHISLNCKDFKEVEYMCRAIDINIGDYTEDEVFDIEDVIFQRVYDLIFR